MGAARNACLSRAADAWRRGDGAAAKRFSREGHDLNAKMSGEMVEAAGKLIRERAKLVEEAVRARDTSWSDDYGDRAARGRLCGAGLGVCLGIASQSVGGAGEGGTKLTPEERTECLLDLHGLHAAEAAEVMEEFLLAVSGCCCCCCFFQLVREVFLISVLNGGISLVVQLEREHFYGLGTQMGTFQRPCACTDDGYCVQLILSLARRSTRELRIQHEECREHGWRLECENGCICGDIHGMRGTV